MRYLVLVFFIVSCNQHTGPKQPDVVISTEKLDTVTGNNYTVTAVPQIFETAFFTGTKAKADRFDISFFAVNIGNINVGTGKLIACDPIVMNGARPFLQTFPIGKFPVQLAIAKIDGDERVAFSRILFSDKPVANWRYALQKGQKEISIFDSTFYGYGVDAGVGIFIDSAANAVFNNITITDKDLWQDVFVTEMGKHTRATWEHLVYNYGNYNLAAFSTGLGDGSYATYTGYDKDGNICRLLTDFGFVQWWER